MTGAAISAAASKKTTDPARTLKTIRELQSLPIGGLHLFGAFQFFDHPF